jgi:hypothetical protein
MVIGDWHVGASEQRRNLITLDKAGRIAFNIAKLPDVFTRTPEQADRPSRIRPNMDYPGSNSTRRTLAAAADNVM